MNKFRPWLQPPTGGAISSQASYLAAIAALFASSLFLILPFQVAFSCSVFFGIFGLRYPWVVRTIAFHPRLRAITNFRVIGTFIGILLFLSITIHANPAFAQINSSDRIKRL
jgi:hypothetical protein